MNWTSIRPLVVKDLKLFFRDRFFAFISILGLVAYAAIYLAMPRSVDELLAVGLFTPVLPDQIAQVLEEEDEPLLLVESEEALRQAVLAGEISAGIVLPEDLFEQLRDGDRPIVTIYLLSDAPDDLREIMEVLTEAMVLAISGAPLNLEVNEEVLGPDMVGQQIPLRDRMVPLLVILALMMETLGLASLLAQEIQTRTIHALLVTPMRVSELITAKGITGLALTFSQAALLMLIIGGFRQRSLILLVALMLGAMFVTAVGFLMASAGKDMLSVMGVGIPVILLLSIPAIGIVFPGLLTRWAAVVPTYYLADTIHQAANFGAGWGQIWQNLVILLAIILILLGVSVFVLKRKFR
jgi:ABC-2 type transport system permease protein